MKQSFRDLLNASQNDLQNASQAIQSSNGSEAINEEVLTSLQTIVDSLVYAGTVALTAHWNLRSSAFVAIHTWFGESYSELFGMADEVAEQIKISDIDLMVNINTFETTVLTNEQNLFKEFLSALEYVESTLNMAANDITLSRPLQNLIDNWITQITKMIWFVKSSIKPEVIEVGSAVDSNDID